jgi:pimeloyl-ACP methyl ester carboxylesterase
MSAVILRDEIIHYEVLGRGRPLIFLHDWIGSWRYWIPAMQAASISFRTYALDFWGFGDSAKNPTYYSIDQQIGLVDEFMEAMGMGKVALIGHGLGAIVAVKFCERYPKLVDRTVAIGFPIEENAIHTRLNGSSPQELADWLLNRTPATEAVWAETPKTDPQAIDVSLANIIDLQPHTLVNNLSLPTLFVHGSEDPLIQTPELERLNRLPPQAHYIIFDGAGHFPMLDAPSTFNRLMSDFLNLSSGESPRQLQLKEEWKRRVR